MCRGFTDLARHGEGALEERVVDDVAVHVGKDGRGGEGGAEDLQGRANLEHHGLDGRGGDSEARLPYSTY